MPGSGRLHRATAIVPLAVLSAAWTASLTGGSVLDDPAARLTPVRAGHARFVELAPYLLRAILLLFLADLAIRRWENVAGMAEAVSGLWRRAKA